MAKTNLYNFTIQSSIHNTHILYVILINHLQILRIDPNSGDVLQTLNFPSLLITSAAFGGPNYEDLYVTSAQMGLTKEMKEKYPYSGYTFKVTGLGVKGTPSVPAVL